MPIYAFKDTRTGKTTELFRTIERRDCVPSNLKRLFSPPRHGGFIVGANADESPEVRVPKALRQLEEKDNWRKIESDTGFSRDELRRVWDC